MGPQSAGQGQCGRAVPRQPAGIAQGEKQYGFSDVQPAFLGSLQHLELKLYVNNQAPRILGGWREERETSYTNETPPRARKGRDVCEGYEAEAQGTLGGAGVSAGLQGLGSGW